MSAFFAVAILFLFIPSEKKNFHSGYLSIRQTNVIKGFFLLLVFMSHFCQYAPVNTKADYFYQLWRMHSGQLLVTLFLFYSGYGTFITVKSKGIAYIKKMPVHRILKTLVNFDAAVCVYLIMQFFRGNSYSVKKILFSLIGWESIGNSNWYIFVMLLLYIAAWLTFYVFDCEEVPSLIGITIMTVIGMYFLSVFKEGYWYNTMMCFPLGMWFSYYKKKIDQWMQSRKIYLYTFFICLLLFVVAYRTRGSLFMYVVWTLTFSVGIVLFTMKIEMKNRILEWTGKNLFPLYIMQRIPMILLQHTRLADQYVYLYAFVCLIFMYVFGFIFGKICTALDNVIFVRKCNQKEALNEK